MLDFAKSFAKGCGCKVIRIDTYAENNPAKKLYVNNGFEIAGYGNIVLQGLIPGPQVYLECLSDKENKHSNGVVMSLECLLD